MVLHVFGSGSAAHDGDSCDRGQRGRPSALVQGHATVLDEAMGTGGGGACAVVRRGSWEHGTIGGELKWVGVRGWGGFCSIPSGVFVRFVVLISEGRQGRAQVELEWSGAWVGEDFF